MKFLDKHLHFFQEKLNYWLSKPVVLDISLLQLTHASGILLLGVLGSLIIFFLSYKIKHSHDIHFARQLPPFTWKIMIPLWMLTFYEATRPIKHLFDEEQAISLTPPVLYTLFLLTGIWAILGALKHARKFIMYAVTRSNRIPEKGQKGWDLHVVLQDKGLNFFLSILGVSVFFFITGRAYFQYARTLWDYRIYGVHTEVVVGACVILYCASKLRKLMRDVLLHIIRIFNYPDVDLDSLKRTLMLSLRRPLMWSSLAFVLALLLFFSQDIQNNHFLSLGIQIALYAYGFYLLIVFSNILHYVIPRSVIQHQILVNAVVKLTKVFIGIMGLITISDKMGVNTSAIIASLGISGVAVALATKSIIENIVSGMVLLIDKPFEVGESIRVGSIAEGKVVDLRFQYTELELVDKKCIFVPNTLVLGSSIENASRAIKKAIDMDFYLDYELPLEKLEKIISDIENFMKEEKDLFSEGGTVYPTSFQDGRFILHISTYSKTAESEDWVRARFQLFSACKRILETNGAAFAVPKQLQITSSEASHHPAPAPA